MSKFLIAGLGNLGEEYSFTRHNIGFEVADALAKSLLREEEKASIRLFTNDKLAMINHSRYKGKQLVIIKPTTYMNLSGKAVNYWMQAEKISRENLLVITDDLALPFGTLRMKKKGSDGGHNGLNDIAETLNTTEYARLRFGIGSEFSKGKQVNYVLGHWNEEEKKTLDERIEKAVEMIKSFVAIGIDRTMTLFNNK
jgi:PTH1 family peptidyl-tRNA hydrolase